MASASNDAIILPASEVSDQTGDVPSQQSSLDGESCIPKASEYFSTSSSTATEPSANESAEFIESKPDDSAFIYFSENIFHGAPNIPKGNTAFATENQIDSALKSVYFDYAESNRSTVIQEIGTNKAIESDRPEKSQSNKLCNATISTQIRSVEENMLIDSQATNLRDASAALDSSDSRCKKDASNLSSVNTRIQIIAKDLKPLTMPERFLRVAPDLSNSEIKSDASEAAAKDIDNFQSMQNTQEYKSGTHFKVLNQSGSGGLVVTTPTTSIEPIFPKIEIPPLLPPTMDYSTHSANPSTSSYDSATLMDTHVNLSLSKLESTLARWVNRGLERVFNRSQQYNLTDFLKYADNELKNVLDILKQMKVRVDTLLKAVENLPDPAFALPQGMEIQNNSIRNDVMDAGMKVWRKLELLEVDANEDNERFVSLCFKNSVHNDERQLEIQALNIISNAYVKVSESFYELNYKIEMFRDKIRDFCSELESFL